MAEHKKYGYCKASKRWVPRDSMLGLNVKVFDLDNEEHRIQLRLSHAEWVKLVDKLKGLEWENDLRVEGEF